MKEDKDPSTFVHKALDGDKFLIDTPSGLVDIALSRVSPTEINVAIRCDRAWKITPVHVNPNRGPFRAKK